MRPACCSCSDGTHTLMSCSSDRTVKLWSLDDRAYMDTLYGHQVRHGEGTGTGRDGTGGEGRGGEGRGGGGRGRDVLVLGSWA